MSDRSHRDNSQPEKPRRRRVALIPLLALAGLAAMAGAAMMPGGPFSATQEGRRSGLAPVEESGPDAIPNQYIIVFDDSGKAAAGAGLRGASVAMTRSVEAERLIRGKADGSAIRETFRNTIIGFSAVLTPATLREVREIAGVAWIEPNRLIELPRPARGQGNMARRVVGGSVMSADAAIEEFLPLGLDRIDQVPVDPLDGQFAVTGDGKGVHVYVIDSGIHSTHEDFASSPTEPASRVQSGVGWNKGYSAFGTATGDCFWHGTHVAGIIGGIHSGVAKKVTLHPVRVFGCQSSTATDLVVKGVEWATADFKRRYPRAPAVANMSVATGISNALNKAVRKSIQAGIVYVVAAGNRSGGPNDTGQACQVSPAKVLEAITVGNIRPTDDLVAGDSNIGACIDIFAPGTDIESTWFAGDDLFETMSGTSMATPHVTGVAALYLQKHPTATPAQVWQAIYTAALRKPRQGWGGISNIATGSPEVLLHWQ